MTTTTSTLLLALLSVLCLSACGDDSSEPATPGPSDAGADTGQDTAPDVPADTMPRDTTPPPDTSDAGGGGDGGDLRVTFAAEAVPLNEQTFGLGVQAGSVRSDRVRLWTHVDDGAPKRLRVWRYTDAQDQVLLAYNEIVEPQEAKTIIVDVDGLTGGEWYSYAFLEGEPPEFTGRSVIGKFRAALPDGALETLKVGATSCTRSADGPFNSLQQLAARSPDVLLHTGDFSYNDIADTLEEYRAEWRNTLADPGYKALLPTAAMYYTWDDHEVVDNWDPEETPASRVQFARQALLEHVPVEEPDGNFWTSYKWGATAEFFVLDSRSERIPSTRLTEEAEYLSKDQMAWLKQGLEESEAHFKIIMTSVPISKLPDVWITMEDRWQGYPAQRQELVDFLVDSEIPNVWFITGDFHLSFITRLEPEGYARNIWEIAVGPGANEHNPLATGVRDGVFLETTVFPADVYEFWHYHVGVTTTLDFDPVADEVRVQYVHSETFELLYEMSLKGNQ